MTKKARDMRRWWRSAGLATAVLILGLGGLALWSLRVANVESLPELRRNAATLARMVSVEITRAVELGIPFDALEGMPEFLRDTLRPHAEIRYAAVSDLSGKVRYGTPGLTEAVLPIVFDAMLPLDDIVHCSYRLEAGGAVVGVLHIGIDSAHTARRLTSLMAEIGWLPALGLLIIGEGLLLLVAARDGGTALPTSRRA